MQRATIIYNPAARNAPSVERLRMVGLVLQSEDWEVTVETTQSPGHATQLAASAALAGAAAVFACGGDGTVNEVVNGLAGSDCALGLVRGGMGNVFAKEIGVPKPPEQALRVLIDGERRRFDLGIAGNRYFLLMAGIGFDATVVRRLPKAPKRWLGSSAYALWAAASLPRYHPVTARLRLNGVEEQRSLYWLLLGNTRSYGGVLDITSRALADDGLLDTYFFAGSGPAWLASMVFRLVLRRQDGGRGVSFHRLSELEILTPGLPVQADGEYLGETPMRFSVAPSSLDVLMPRGRGAHLLAADA